MAHIPISELKQVEKDLQNYNISKYLITAESKPYEHLHYYVEFTEKQYERYRDNILKRKYKLRGKATKGKPRQFGKITKALESPTTYLSYILKDKGPLATNMTKEYLASIPPWEYNYIPGHEFKDYVNKKDKKDFIEEIQKYQKEIDSTKDTYRLTTRDIAILWLEKMDQTLPRWDTLIYMCYKANLISKSQYANIKYRDVHTLVTKSMHKESSPYDNHDNYYTNQFQYPTIN